MYSLLSPCMGVGNHCTYDRKLMLSVGLSNVVGATSNGLDLLCSVTHFFPV